MLTTRRNTNLTTGEAIARGYEMDGSFIAVLITKDGSHHRLTAPGTSADEELDQADAILATWIARGDQVR